MQISCHPSREGDALRAGGLRHFVAGRIGDDARMVVVLLHHILKVLFPPVFQIGDIVVLRLVHGPRIGELIHHQHAETVTGVKDGFGAGIVGAPQRIVTIFLVKSHLALFRLRERAGTEESVIVMDAGTAKDHPLPIDGQAVRRIPGQCSDAEGLLHHVVPERHAGGVQVRMFGIPELRVRNTDLEVYQLLAADVGFHSDGLLTVQDLHADLAGLGDTDLHIYYTLTIILCVDPDTVHGDIFFSACPYVDRTVDAGARIPAAVGLIRISGNDLEFVLFPELQGFPDIHIKIGIPVGTEGQLLPVHPYLSVVIDAFELQENVLPLPLCRGRESFCVLVISADIPADIPLAAAFRAAGFADHGIVRKCDLPLPGITGEASHGPFFIECSFFHK